MIIDHVPAPQVQEGPLQMLVAAMDHSDYVGRIGVGRIVRGTLKAKQPVVLFKRDGSEVKTQARQLLRFRQPGHGARSTEVQCGDICAVVGLEGVDIGDTLADAEHPEPLDIIAVDDPTLSMSFRPNDSPGYGQEGKYVTSRQVRDRLFRAMERDVALRVEDAGRRLQGLRPGHPAPVDPDGEHAPRGFRVHGRPAPGHLQGDRRQEGRAGGDPHRGRAQRPGRARSSSTPPRARARWSRWSRRTSGPTSSSTSPAAA